MIKNISKQKRVIIIVALLLSTVVSVFIYQQIRSKAETIKLDNLRETSLVKQGNVSVSISTDGMTHIEKHDLSFEIGGVIRNVTVKEGDTVSAWQTLAYLDIAEAQKNLEKSMRDYLKERTDFDEGEQVTYSNIALTDTFKRILDKNQWDLEKSVLDVELKDIAMKKSYLTTPIDGIVAQVNYQAGDIVSTQNNSTVLTVVNENSFNFESYVEDVDALKIKKDMAARVSLDAIEGTIVDGVVSFVSPLAKLDENGLSTYKVLISFNDENLHLIDGLSGEAEIISKEAKNVLIIPNKAVTREGIASIVFLKQGDNFIKKTIKLGFTNGSDVEVISGLVKGDEVLLHK